jgi:hypothetical protein
MGRGECRQPLAHATYDSSSYIMPIPSMLVIVFMSKRPLLKCIGVLAVRMLRCRQIHSQGGTVTQMIGAYNPNERDPSHSMLRIATREWDTDRLEEGCRLVEQGMSERLAARQVCLCLGSRNSGSAISMLC